MKKRQSPDFRSLEAGISANRHLVSSLGRAPVCQAGGHGFKPQPDQHSGSLIIIINNNNFIYIALKSNNCPKRYLITK